MKRNNVVLRALNTVLSSWLVLTLLVPVHMFGWVTDAKASTSARVTEVQPLNVPRLGHTATVLPGDRVLVIGGENAAGPVAAVESFDLTTGAFSLAGNLITARVGHKATLLDDGRVLITGGHNSGGALNSAEIYDPATQTSQAIADMTAARNNHSATKMLDGRVLLAGGDAAGTAELFDPMTVAFTSVGSLQQVRAGHSATLFSDNSVFLAGGGANTAEFFDLTNQTFTLVAQPMTAARTDSTAISTTDAKVLMVGGDAGNTVEQFDPTTETFTVAATLPMTNSSATLLANDKVLVLGSDMAGVLSVDSSNQWEDVTSTNAVPLQRTGQTVSELATNKQMLVIGGINSSNELVGAAVLFNPARITTDRDDYPPFSFVDITGSGFLPGETVSNQVQQIEGPATGAVYDGWEVVANSNGEFTTSWLVFSEDLADTMLELTAKGLTSGLMTQTRFTDAVTVTAATGGTSISADKAQNASAPDFTTLGNIVITEGVSSDFAAGTGKTLILTAPTGWSFNPGVGSVSYTASRNITAASIAVAASTITVTLTVVGTGSLDTLTISGIQVQATNGANVPGSGNILRTSANPGTATITGITNGSTNFGSLSQAAGAAAKLAFTTQPPVSTTAGATMANVIVQIQDQFGNSVSQSGTGITLTPNGSTLFSGTNPQNTDASGKATFNNLVIRQAGTGLTFTANGGSLTAATSSTFNINAATVSSIVFVQQPSASVTAGQALSPSVTVRATDTYGNNVSSLSINMALVGTGALSGTSPRTTGSDGIATFNDLSVNLIGAGDKLRATVTVPSLTVDSSTFNVTAATASKLAFTTQPANAAAGATMASIAAQVQDQFGNSVAQSGTAITLTVSNGGPTGGTNPQTTDANGKATFSDLSLTEAGNGLTLTANGGGLAAATSTTFNISVGAFTKLQLLVPGETADPGSATGKTGTPTAQTAGTAFTVTVNAVDAYWNVVSSTHTIRITSSDGAASMPANAALVAGTKTFSVPLKTAGSQTVTATDFTDGTKTANTSPAITVNPAAANKLVIQTQPSTTAIAGQNFAQQPVVLIQDTYGNLRSADNSTVVTAARSAGTATLQGTLTATAVNGVVTFTDLSYDKAETLTIAFSASGLTGVTSGNIVVSPGSFTKLQLLMPGETAAAGTTTGKTGTPTAQTAGTAFSVTVNAVDDNWNMVSSATDTAGISSSDSNASLPANAALVAGTKTFSVTLKTAGSQTVTASDVSTPAKTANTSPATTVNAGAATKLQVLMPGETAAPGSSAGKTGSPSIQTAGAAFTVTVNAVDANWNLVSSTHTVGITTTDANDVLPANAALVAGTKTFAISNKTAGNWTVTATDITTGLIANTGSAYTVNAAAFAKLQVLLPGETAAAGTTTGKTGSPTAQTAGTAFNGVVINAVDANWNLISSITDTVTLDSSDATATLPADAALINGTVTFNGLTFKTAGSAAVTATDVADGTKNGTSASVTVNVGAFVKLQLLVPGETAATGTTTGKTGTPSAQTAGTAFNVTVRAVDANWNLVSSTHTIRITSSDGAATMPANAALVAGSQTFSVPLKTAGSQTVTATDFTDGTKTANTSPAITVNPAAANKLVIQTQPSTTAIAGQNFVQQPVILIQDTYGNLRSTDNSTVVTAARSAGTATLQGTLTATAVNGVVTFADLSYDKAETLTIAFSASGLTGITSGNIVVSPGVFTKLQLLMPGETAAAGTTTGKTGTPTAQTAGTAFSVTVTAVDDNWNLISSATHTIDISASDANAALPADAALVAGTKTFSVTLKTAGSRTVTASDVTDGSKTANTSPATTVNVGAATKLQVLMPGETAAPGTSTGKTGTPTVQTAGTAFTITVNAVDVNWNVANSTHTIGVTTTDANDVLPANAALVAGTKTFAITNRTAGNWTATATDLTTGLTVNTGSTYTVNPAGANKLAFTTQPVSTTAGTTMGNVVVQLQDTYGNAVPQSGTAITLTLNGSTLYSGTNPQSTDANGTATFNDLVIRQAANGLTLTAGSSGLTGATSSSFNITPATASQIQFVQNPPASVTAGSTFSPAVTVKVSDVYGNGVGSLSMTMSLNGSGVLTGGGAQTTASGTGLATFSGLSINQTGSKTLTANVASPALSTTSGSFTVTPGAIHHYVVSLVSPQTRVVSFNITVTAQDVNNNTVTTDSSTVVTMTSTGNMQFDGASDSTFTTDTKTLSSGAFTINSVDEYAESITVTATDSNGKTGFSSVLVVNPATGDFQSKATGNWNATGTWQTWNGASWANATTTPAGGAGTNIVVLSSHTVTDNVAVNLTGTIIVQGTLSFSGSGAITVSSGGILRSSGTVNSSTSTLAVNAGGTYQHNQDGGTIPTANWNVASTVEITGWTSTITWNGSGTGLGQGFGNFVWNSPSQSVDASLAANLTNVNGDLIVENTNGHELRLINSGGSLTLTIDGNLEVQTGLLDLHNTSESASTTVNLGGSLIIRSGATVTSGNSTQASTINFTGTGGQFTLGGTFTTTYINFNVNNGAVLTLNDNLSVASGRTLTVNSGGTLTVGPFAAAQHVSGAGAFTLASGGTLGIADPYGILTGAGTGATGGSIQVTGTRTYNTAANYIYNGTAAQATGTGLPTTANSLTISNTAAVVTLSRVTTITTTVTLASGAVLNLPSGTSTTANLAIGGVNRASGTWGNTGSGASHIDSTDFVGTGVLSVGTGVATVTTLTRHAGTGTSSTYGDILSFDVTVTGPTPTGTVTLKDGGANGTTIGSGPLSGGTVTITLTATALAAGSHANIVAVYAGDDYFNTSTSSALSAQTVTAKPLTVTGVTANNKGYNGNTTATLNTGSAALVGVVSGDTVNLNVGSATGAFANKNVGAGKTVTVSGLTITGGAAANYTLTQPTTTADITALALTVTAATNSKTYDGTTSAAATPTVTGGAVQSGDTANFTESYDTKNVGTSKTLTPTGTVTDGNSGNNYTYSFVTVSTGTITARALTVTAVTNTKTYDGTTIAAATPTITVGAVQSGDTANFTEVYSSSTVGAANKTLIPSGTVTDGNSGNNYTYTFANFTTGTITAKALTVTGLTAGNKVYDKTTAATLAGTAALQAAEPTGTGTTGDGKPYTSDTVNVTGTPSGTFASANAANGITVNISGLSLTGAQAGNYTLTAPTSSANITAKALTVTGLTANNKTYDKTTTATLSGTAALLASEAAGAGNSSDGTRYTGDTVSLTGAASGTFASTDVANGILVTISGLSLTGAQAGNYTLTAPSSSANITARAVSLSGSRVYDGTTTAAAGILTVANNLDGANLTLSGSGSLASKNVGSPAISAGTLALGGTAAGNYTLTGLSGTVTVSALPVQLTGTRAFDNTTTAVAGILTVVNNLDGANLTLSGSATLASKNIGTQAITSFASLTLGGSAAANYTKTAASGSVTITAGAASAITVETAADGSGSVVTTQNITAGNSVTVYAIARDTGGNFVGNPNSTWSLTSVNGGVVSGDLTSSVSPSATFTGHLVGSAAIHVVNGSLNADSSTLTVVPGALANYAVTASSPQDTGVPFNATVTARDSFGNTVTTDSSTVVTLSASTGNVQFDSNANNTYGDNTMTLASGTFAIRTRDNVAETITITATDANGKTGISANVAINTFPTDWKYRKQITIDHTKVPNTDQVDFPVLINLASDSGLAAHAQSSGNDILFTASDGTTTLPYEREKYTSGTGALIAWVKVANLSHTTDTILYLYYGNASAADQQDVQNVWDTNFKLVYHLGDAGPTTANDSTINGNDGTQSGGVTFGATGQVDGATTYSNGASSPNQTIAAASAPYLNPNGSFTYRMWIKVTGSYAQAASTADASGSYFLDRTAATAGNPLVSLIGVTGSKFGYQTRYDDGTGIGGPSGGTPGSSWQLVEMVRDYNTAFRLYVNGISVGTTTDSGSKALTPPVPKLGRHATFNSGTPGLNGGIDEFRISSIARSADWIKTEYNNESSPSTFASLGIEQAFTVTTASAATANYNPNAQTVTLSATVTSTAGTVNSGSVTFTIKDGATTIGTATASTVSGGNATVSYTLPAATTEKAYTIIASYTSSGGSFADSSDNTHLLTLSKATPAVTTWPTASGITYGQALSASTLSGGMASVAGSFAFTTSSTTPGAGTYSAAVTFTPSDTAHYNTVAGTVNVAVAKATPVITWNNPADISYGTALSGTQLNATSGGVAGTFVYTPASGTVLSTGNGQTLSVQFTPTDTANYNTPAVKTVTINVGKTTPTITTWPTASGITYGQALSASTLSDGSASVAGTFTFTTPTTTPGAGTYSAAVTFTPSDTANYNTVAGTVNVAVAKATPTVTVVNSPVTYNGSARTATVNGSVAGTVSNVKYNGSATAPTAAGTYTITADFAPTDSTDYNSLTGALAGNFVIQKVTPTLSVANSPVVYTGAAQSATVNSSVAGSINNVKYNGLATVPTSVGTYAVTADFAPTDSTDYNSLTGAAAGNFVIQSATPTLSVANSPVTYNGSTQAATVNSSVPGVVSSVQYNGSATVPTTVGSYAITANFVPTDTANYSSLTGAAAGNFVIQKATPTVSVANSPVTYNGSAQAATVNGSVAGAVSNVRYNGSATVPTAAGTYAITVDFAPTDGTDYNALTGASAGNFVINPTSLVITASAQSKTYGTAIALGTTAFTTSGLQSGDSVTSVTLSSNGGTAATDAVGSYTITPSAAVGAGLGNYTVTYTTSTLTVDPLAIQLTGTRAYDGTTTAAAGILTMANEISGDTVTLSGSATLANKGVGTRSISSFGGLTLGGASAGNYTLSGASGSVSITMRLLTVTATGQDKSYDGNTTATVALADDRASGDTLTTGYTSATFADKNVGNGKSVSVTGVTVTGADSVNYTFNSTASTTANITAKALTITAATNTKTYDATTSAAATPTVNGLQGSDTVTGLTETYDTKHVGTSKTLSVVTYTVNDGNSGNNYTVSVVDNTTGVISARAITVTAATNSKIYSGTTSAAATPTITAGTLQGSDAANFTESYDTKNVGTGKTLTPTGSVSDGNSGNNYAVTFVNNTTGVITAKGLTITAASNSKTYDSTTSAAATPTISGLQGSDTVTGLTETYDTKHVGTGKTLSVVAYTVNDGNSGNNYTVSTVNNTTGVINTKVLTVTAATNTKAYDGTTSAAATPTVSGLLGGDTVTGLAETYDTKNVGTGKALSVVAYTVNDGNSGNNYAVSTVNNTTGVITGKSLTITGIIASNKTYDGSTTATLNTGGATLVGVSDTDVVTLNVGSAVGAFADNSVGNAKTVNISGLTISGADAASYSFTQPTATADITARTLTVSATGQNKVYNGNTTATVTLSDNRLSGDSLTVSYAGAAFTDKNVGTGKTVNVDGIAISGADAGNYTANTTATTTANITAAGLTVTGITANNKAYDGTTTATLNTSGAALVSNFDGGNVVLSTASAAGSFANKNVGSGKTVTIAGLTISGGDAGNYTLAQPNTTADITLASLTITANNRSKTYGQTVTFSGTEFTTSAMVSGDAVSSVSLSSTGAGPGAGAGSYSIIPSSAVGTGLGNYTISYANGTLNVAKATPVITWGDPSDITYGTALSGTQLNATANVPGAMAYSPASGALLNTGNHQALNVTFTPTDSANYTTATATAYINIAKADTTTGIASSVNPSVLGQATVLTATVASTGGTPAGSVTFMDGVTSLGTATMSGGQATLSTTALTVGSHSITAVYNGNGNFNSSTSAVLTQLVNGAPPVVTTQPSSQTAVAGDATTFTASAAATPAAQVQWQASTDGGVTFNNIAGATSTTLSFSPNGADHGKKYRALFSNGVGSASSTPASLTVLARNVTPSVKATYSGMTYNTLTKLYTQSVTIQNIGTQTFEGPLSMALDNLSSNAALSNKSGSTALTSPAGMSYRNATVTLSPGASTSITLQFTNPTGQPISYATRVLVTTGQR